ncbi:MAG: hypothetical protein ACD_17C00291G0006 [uncultured bacterium]|nr:MAG: hypothetical protein ACD_17C00291G0006 [uncultured bacterium]OGN55871.1 MAG: hypothetical protein A2796_07430 [Chlamydiae bacterium RIFCSPHIGHO2_01_FULL_44_39]OGN57323.1 MAG: hypothetical protein A3C42_03195 [Chlamydiae bacterium RIFCSPHIGHO2_02_FULL_45_9]OGN60820.1 MAG: hypothetical protein A3D96_00285 [Chlamydiae bacterium RIFCSPHIGHO2_12_FULL_44_59]OGN66696.1 MAG: hypothetical protein A2978_02920 [Chlamydiae bacterium RIFCSPLOWO2_01_FULL_44_52]OGN67346.1 MAG: hypothetical protein A3
MKGLIVCLFLSGCFYAGGAGVSPLLGIQKKRVTHLEERLSRARDVIALAETDVERLKEEISREKLKLIRMEIDHFEKKEGSMLTFFIEEREALYEMIESGPASAALEAQVELDRILRMITEQSEEVF